MNGKIDSNCHFWENIHKENNRYWLTDSDPDYVYRLHGIKDDLDISGKNILEIGIGTGKSILKLSNNHNVYAVDIAEDALNKVKDKVTAIQTYDWRKWPINKIDIALCHLVFQHCDDSNFKFIIEQVLRSLCQNGYFSFQSANAEYANLDLNYRRYVKEGHMFFRSKDVVRNIIEELGGKIIKISDDILHPYECNIVWNIFKIIRLI